MTAAYRVTVEVRHHHTYTVHADNVEQACAHASNRMWDSDDIGEHDVLPAEIARVETRDTGADLQWDIKLGRDDDGNVTIGFTATAYPDNPDGPIPDGPWHDVAAALDRHFGQVPA
jgi:hypothetical protein